MWTTFYLASIRTSDHWYSGINHSKEFTVGVGDEKAQYICTVYTADVLALTAIDLYSIKEIGYSSPEELRYMRLFSCG